MAKLYAVKLNDSSQCEWTSEKLFCINRNKKQTEELVIKLNNEFPYKQFTLLEFTDYPEDNHIKIMVHSYSDWDSGFIYEHTNASEPDVLRIKKSGVMAPFCHFSFDEEENLYLEDRLVTSSINKKQLNELYVNELGIDNLYEYRADLKYFKKHGKTYIFGRYVTGYKYYKYSFTMRHFK